MQRVGDRGDQFRRIPEGRSSLSNPDRQIASFDELRDDVTESILRATNVMYRHDVGMVQPGENAGFGEKRFHSFRIEQRARGSAT